MYKLGFIGQDGSSDGWITSPDGSVMQNLDTGAVVVLPDPSSPVPSLPSQTGGDWFSWGTVKDVLAPLASVAGSIVKAVTGQQAQQVPPGYRYNSITGRFEPIGTATTSAFPNWLLPVGLLGVGAVMLMRKR